MSREMHAHQPAPRRATTGLGYHTHEGPARTPRRPMGPASDQTRQQFVALSAILTAFTDAELWGTGMVDPYLDWVRGIIGDSRMGTLLSTSQAAIDASNGKPDELDRLVTLNLLEDDMLGPIVRNLIVLWYLGEWNQLPADWRDAHGASALDMHCIISPDAYAEGLVWKAIGTHPQGAKQPGYGSWALPPVIPEEPAPRKKGGARRKATGKKRGTTTRDRGGR